MVQGSPNKNKAQEEKKKKRERNSQDSGPNGNFSNLCFHHESLKKITVDHRDVDYLCGSNEPQNLSTEDAGLQIGHLKAIRRNHWRTSYTAQNKIMYAIENFLKNHVPSNSSVEP